jgi:CTP:molybdopterin cytidylyltransferase MocA
VSALLDLLLAAPAALLLALALFLALEIAGAFLPRRAAPAAPHGRIAVVIPAHDEAGGVARTVADARADLAGRDLVLVVADNCTDGTAAAAAAAGATVLTRSDPARRGKGYALQFAIDHLKADPPGVVVFVDADCRIEKGAIRRLAAAAASGRPAQALDLMVAPEGAPPARAVAEFAWAFLNRARMSGLYRVFGVSRLLGTGMAIPWGRLKAIDLASGETVEDLALSFDLAAAGAPAHLCLDAKVTSVFPSADDAAVRQRARWEVGALRMARSRAPRLLIRALGRGDVRLAALALDGMIPPLAVFAGLLLGLAALAALLGASTALALCAAAAIAFAAAVAAGWAGFGRDILPPEKLGALAAYARDKIAVWRGPARRSADEWTRAGRDGAKGGP